MGEAVRLQPENSQAPAAEPVEPRVLTRLVTAPPAAPWEQGRAARLEARLGAPLPLAELTFQVKRLSRWRPGAPGRFGVFYVRTRELRGPLETTVTVDDQVVPLAFGRTAPRVPQVGQWGLALLVIALSGAVAGAAVTLGLRARLESSDRLEAVERLAASKLAAAQAYRRSLEQERALRAAIGRGAPVAEVLDDFTWVAGAKTPDARIVGLHWREGVLGVEVHGDPPPFGDADRRLQRAPRQLRPGVWLWGVGPPGSAPPGTRAR